MAAANRPIFAGKLPVRFHWCHGSDGRARKVSIFGRVPSCGLTGYRRVKVFRRRVRSGLRCAQHVEKRQLPLALFRPSRRYAHPAFQQDLRASSAARIFLGRRIIAGLGCDPALDASIPLALKSNRGLKPLTSSASTRSAKIFGQRDSP